MKLSTESRILLALGTADLVATIALMHAGYAFEGNPIFAWILAHGLVFFIAAKMALVIGPIAIFEYARKSHPRFAKVGQRVAIAGYVVLYILGTLAVNFVFV
jgi:hypothetical protein